MAKQINSHPKLYGLLIGIDCYPPHLLSLAGSVSDINYVEEFLLRQPQKPTKIFKLTASNPNPDTLQPGEVPKPTEAESQLPTYKNIVTQFHKLTETAAPGDLVYIQYSGHGGRAKTNYPHIKGENDIDEGLIPVDIGTSEGQYLRDLELATLLKRMVDKGLVVTLVLDCCHSGGTVRGKYADIRGLDTIDQIPRPLSNLVASQSELAANWLSLKPKEVKNAVITRKATAVASMLPEVKGYVLLAACRPSESAWEYTIDGKQRNGALTYWLLDTLNQPMPGMTYKMVHDRISAKIKTLFPQQTPMLMGEGDRVVFGNQYVHTEYAVNVMQVKVKGNITKVELDAGQAQGLRKGAELAIYPRGLTSFRNTQERLALVEITELKGANCWADVTTMLQPESVIEQGAQAVLTSAPVKLVKKVQLLQDQDLPLERNAALQAVQVALTGNGWLELVGLEEAADYQIDVKKITSITDAETYRVGIDEVIYEICDRTGAPIVLRPVIRVRDNNAAETVVKRLVHLAKYQGIQELDNHDGSSPLRGKVVIELLGTQKDYASGDAIQPEPFADLNDPEMKAGEHLFLKIHNNYSDIINVAVLDLGSDWAIEQISPQTSQFTAIDPGQEEFIPMNMSLLEGEYEGEDIFKVFATIGMANFRWLELPPLDQPILPPEARGVSRSDGALDKLLMMFAAEQPPTRKANPMAFPSREWTTVQVRVRVKGDEPTEGKPNQSSSSTREKILILIANPQRNFQLSSKTSDIAGKIWRSASSDKFQLEQREVVSTQDVQNILSEVQPRIVHFCGQGNGSQGLLLQDNEGQLVSREAIANLFQQFANGVECVLFNGCYSQVQTEALGQYINYVISMGEDFRGDAAIAFTVGFYQALGSGKTIESAYKLGCDCIQLEIKLRTPTLPEEYKPVWLKKPDSELTWEEFIQKLVQIEELVNSASELPAATKDKSLRYLLAAQEEAQATEPDKEFAASNLKRVAETLKNVTETVTSTQTLWGNVEPILLQLNNWLKVDVS
ncbi:caspase family protein [Calothrix rhizosoleniae]|uniref:caspase family protein n=1 Tax=Calothrix rhizosoleniae TaxID=888997 RepID=UPI000B4A42C5|nr:caspase family protein [Calothrix rhizosoleniae]